MRAHLTYGSQLVNLLYFKLTGTFEKPDISAPDGGTKNQGHRLEDGTEGERRGVVSLGVQEQKQVNTTTSCVHISLLL